MQPATQFSVFLVNRPTVLAQVCEALARDHVNLVAMSLMDSTEHGVMRLVTDDTAKARTSLKRLGLPTAETEVLLVELAHRPGALADVCARLGGEHVGIHYAYCTGAAPNGRSLAVLKVSDMGKALSALDSRRPRRKVVLDRRVRVRRA